ncbi:DNA methyltransferase [Peribacillus frigoritolerans]
MLGSAKATSKGTLSIKIPVQKAGTKLTVTVKDSAGNVSSSVSVTVVDVVAPSKPTEFPSQIAQVGLLLMKHQLDKEVSNYFGIDIIDFPIRETANIFFGNALRTDWEDIIEKDKCSYIIGNPPFF